MPDYFSAGSRGGASQQGQSWDWSRFAAGGAQAESWSTPEAFLGVLIGAVMSDGASSQEIEELQAIVNRSRALKTLAPDQLAEATNRIALRIQKDPSCVAAACAALPAEMRPSVFAHALDLILADSELNSAESEFLNKLITNLQLDERTVQHIADVLFLKNRY